ncbi:hypothetical protein, partial [Shigella sonnei]|uniref:hypothetical protein n=1 Tax=Shigella sonnei TaxID=624 RepID=UPI001C0A74B9
MTRVTTPDSETTRVIISMVKKISMRSLFAMFFYDLRKALCLNSHFFRISQKLTQCAEKIKTGSHCHPFSESDERLDSP